MKNNANKKTERKFISLLNNEIKMTVNCCDLLALRINSKQENDLQQK